MRIGSSKKAIDRIIYTRMTWQTHCTHTHVLVKIKTCIPYDFHFNIRAASCPFAITLEKLFLTED